MKRTLFIIIFSLLFLAKAFSIEGTVDADSLDRALKLAQEAKIQAVQKEIEITIRNVDISKFPEINVIIEAFNNLGQPLDSLSPQSLTVLENGVVKKIISVKRLSTNERVPVDFVFLIDKTGTMQNYMNSVMSNITSFATSLMARGIDYQIGLILFTDTVDEIYQPSNNVLSFLNWLRPVKATGGHDIKENALEALEAVTRDKNSVHLLIMSLF